MTKDFDFTSFTTDKDQQLREVAAQVNASFKMQDRVPIPVEGDPEKELVRVGLGKDSSTQEITPPFSHCSYPESKELYSVHPMVKKALKKADLRFLRYKFAQTTPFGDLITKEYMTKHVWGVDPPQSLKAIIIQKESMYHWALGTTNGRPHVISAMSNLYPKKMARAVLKTVVKPGLPPAARGPLEYLNEAMDMMYKAMRVNSLQTQDSKFSAHSLMKMYLGASGGLKEGSHSSVDLGNGVKLKINPSGKKVDSLETDIRNLITALREDKMPEVQWNVSPKDENYFSFMKQWDDTTWESWIQKLRIFMIPSSIYNIMENLVSQTRHHLERGWVIQIGHKWAKGGVDRLAKCLGINKKNCRAFILQEGDYEGLDVSVLEPLLNAYFSSMLMHEKPGTPDYHIKEKLLRWITQCQIMRVVRLFGDIFVAQEGGVPSGMFNTSHCDSWVTALLFFLFLAFTIRNAPEGEQAELQEIAIALIKYICYGDDLLYNATQDEKAQQYFNIDRFAEFVKTYFNMSLRDTKRNLPFVSDTFGGWITTPGASFLKHFFVENPVKTEGQAEFLPFRESREILIRAIHGRESKARDPTDVMLSLIGHAFGTYAANRDCYIRQQYLFLSLMTIQGTSYKQLLHEKLETLDIQSIRKMRQMGITSEEIAKGFPSWDQLVEKNVVDWALSLIHI